MANTSHNLDIAGKDCGEDKSGTERLVSVLRTVLQIRNVPSVEKRRALSCAMGKTEIQETGKTWTKGTKVSWRRMQTRAWLICSLGNGLRFSRLNNGSCMSREAHVQFCEGLAGQFRWPTLLVVMTKTKEELPAALSYVKEIIEGKLEMKLSEDKTRLTNFKQGFRFLGYNFMGKNKGVSMKSLDKLKDAVRDITKRTQGVNLQAVIDTLNPVIRGHVNYFRLGNVQTVYRQLDCWIRMRLRCFKFSRKWKTDNKRFPVHRFFKMGLLSFEREFLKACAKA